jgi:hypothetical protein
MKCSVSEKHIAKAVSHLNRMKIIYFPLFVSVLSSCAILKSDKFIDGQIELSEKNIDLLNGEYMRASINPTEKPKGDLFWNFYTTGYSLRADSLYSVTLKVIDGNHLNVTLLKSDSVIKSKTLKGKLKNGYFEMKRRKFIVPAIFLNIFRTTKFRIGLLENNNLTTDYKQISWGTVFVVIPFHDKETEPNFEYQKLN